MFSKPIAVGLLALACVTAAAGGAYVAIRSTSAVPASAAAPAAATTPAATSPAVQDTEAVVSGAAAPAAIEKPRPAPVPAPGLTTPSPSASAPAPRPKPASAPTADTRRPAPPAAPAPNRGPAAVNDGSPAHSANGHPAAAEPAAPVRPEPVATPDPVRPEPARPEPPPVPELVELEVPAASVIGLQIETPVSTERARVEDRVEARVMRDVTVDGRTAIPAGAKAVGAVTLVERGGKIKERARLGVRFHTLVLADGSQLPIRTDTIMREGESQAGDSARKIGGAAVGGAILGALIGGKKGAAIGSATGAAGGTAVAMSGDRSEATLASGAVVTVRLSAPVQVEVEKK